jgi:hypothetical protein
MRRHYTTLRDMLRWHDRQQFAASVNTTAVACWEHAERIVPVEMLTRLSAYNTQVYAHARLAMERMLADET